MYNISIILTLWKDCSSMNLIKSTFRYQPCFVCIRVCSIVKMHGMNQLILRAQIVTSPQCMGPVDTEIRILSIQPDCDSHNKWGHSDDVLCFHLESIHGISFSILCFQWKKQTELTSEYVYCLLCWEALLLRHQPSGSQQPRITVKDIIIIIWLLCDMQRRNSCSSQSAKFSAGRRW